MVWRRDLPAGQCNYFSSIGQECKISQAAALLQASTAALPVSPIAFNLFPPCPTATYWPRPPPVKLPLMSRQHLPTFRNCLWICSILSQSLACNRNEDSSLMKLNHFVSCIVVSWHCTRRSLVFYILNEINRLYPQNSRWSSVWTGGHIITFHHLFNSLLQLVFILFFLVVSLKHDYTRQRL